MTNQTIKRKKKCIYIYIYIYIYDYLINCEYFNNLNDNGDRDIVKTGIMTSIWMRTGQIHPYTHFYTN